MTHDPSQPRILDTFIDEFGREAAQATLSRKGGESIMYASPSQAIPVIFLPGIMGSPLVATGKNQDMWDDQGAWAWWPDSKSWMAFGYSSLSAIKRQQLLNPNATRALEAPAEGQADLLQDRFKGSTIIPWKEAYRRGWGTVMLKSYGDLLLYLEAQLRFIFYRGNIYPGTHAAWVPDAAVWGEVKGYERLSEAQLRAAAGWRFPVYAVGYNWLRSNGEGAVFLKERVEAIRQDCRERLKVRCDKVILVTHSMGGLLARAYAKQHPEDVLGIVHGVQPAIGAAAAYARVRAGWESNFHLDSPVDSFFDDIASKIIGPSGREVTTVFAGAAGPLELLPNQQYGSHWLQVQGPDKQTLFSLPNIDPYEEIYKRRDVWWRLIHPYALVDSTHRTQYSIDTGWGLYLEQLSTAQDFHAQLGNYYHPNTYAYCGSDDRQKAWHRICWRIKSLQETHTRLWARPAQAELIRHAQLATDYMLGSCEILDTSTESDVLIWRSVMGVTAHSRGDYYRATLQEQDAAGDSTVPIQSSSATEPFVPFFARMAGFDHQKSYQDDNVQAVTLYSILRMAANATPLP